MLATWSTEIFSNDFNVQFMYCNSFDSVFFKEKSIFFSRTKATVSHRLQMCSHGLSLYMQVHMAIFNESSAERMKDDKFELLQVLLGLCITE